MRILIVAAVAALTLLSGCSTTPSAQQDAIISLTVQYATAKYIEKRPNSGPTIVRVAEAAKGIVDGDATATLATLQEVVAVEIGKVALSPADRVLANALVQLIVAELQAKIGDGLLKDGDRVRVVQILDLVIASASA